MRRYTMRKLIITCFALMLFVTVLAGRSMVTSMAKEEKQPLNSYYKSIQIKDGDSLWDIANRYREGSPMNMDEYIKELKQMNGLKKDTIHTGQYLTVMYYK